MPVTQVIDVKAARSFAELQRQASIRTVAAREKTINKYPRYQSTMAAQVESLLSQISALETASADSSELTTILVDKGSSLPQLLQEAFDDAARPPPLALLAQVLQLIVPIRSRHYFNSPTCPGLIPLAEPRY